MNDRRLANGFAAAFLVLVALMCLIGIPGAGEPEDALGLTILGAMSAAIGACALFTAVWFERTAYRRRLRIVNLFAAILTSILALAAIFDAALMLTLPFAALFWANWWTSRAAANSD